MMESKNSFQLRLDLGIRRFLQEWKELFSGEWLKQDLFAGLIVSFATLPLSLAIALASGVSPEFGLKTAMVVSVICGLFGGTALGVTGPAAVVAVLVASVVQEYGLSGLFIVGFACGFLQLATGVLGLGRLFRLVPFPVIAGLSAGIGAVLLIGEIPRSLGLPPPDESHVLDVIFHITDLIHETRASSLALAMSALGLSLALPRFFPKVPGPLAALVLPTLVVMLFGIHVETIGSIPSLFQVPGLPEVHGIDPAKLFGVALLMYVLTSLEALLASNAIAKLTQTQSYDPNQELIGQGIGNMASALLGGIPATGVIARSSLNVQAGAKTRRSAIFHALFLALMVFVGSPWIAHVPVPVLSGILISIVLRMLHPREFIEILRASRMESLIYLTTFFVVIFVDLAVGVQAGVIAAVMVAGISYGYSRTRVHVFDSLGPVVISIDGPLSFLSSSKIETIRSSLKTMELGRGLVMDMSQVTSIDGSGARQLVELVEQLLQLKVAFAMKGLSPECRRAIFSLDLTSELREEVAKHIASNQFEVSRIFGRPADEIGLDHRLVYGVERFKQNLKHGRGALFKTLAEQQNPHTLFITCSDSRIDPNLITSTEPGELFIVRNVGNIIPPFGVDQTPAEGAAVEFSIGVLGVKHVVVCGHSGCGAMKALTSGDFFSEKNQAQFPNMVKWLQVAHALKQQLPKNATLSQAAELNALLQLENLKTYPLIREKLEKGLLRLSAWYYDIGEAELEEWDEKQKIFVQIGSENVRSLEKRMEAGIQFQVPKL